MKNWIKFSIVVRLFALALCGLGSNVEAFKLTPMKMTLGASGRASGGVFSVNNMGQEALAIEMRFMTREMADDGSETNKAVPDLFAVFPSQFVLKPGTTQTVRVRWLGKEPVKSEKAFRLVAEQLPVSLVQGGEEGINMKVALRYLAAVYVAPKGAKADVQMEVKREGDSSGRSFAVLDFHNAGTEHVILRNLKVSLQVAGRRIELPTEVMESVSGSNLLAGARRVLRIPLPSDAEGKTVIGDFSYDK